MKELLDFDNDSNIHRVFIQDTASATGGGKTGLTYLSTGLIISTIADKESAPVVYTVTASNVETIASLGTYSAPTSGKCRFKEVDATNLPGIYELQFEDSRYAVSGATKLQGLIFGASGVVPCPFEIQLDPNAATQRSNVTAIKAKTDLLPEGIKKNQALNNFPFLMVDSTDNKTGKTGLTVTATRSIDGAAFAACANAVVEVSAGIYKINLAASDLNGDTIALRFTGTGANDRIITIKTAA